MIAWQVVSLESQRLHRGPKRVQCVRRVRMYVPSPQPKVVVVAKSPEMISSAPLHSTPLHNMKDYYNGERKMTPMAARHSKTARERIILQLVVTYLSFGWPRNSSSTWLKEKCISREPSGVVVHKGDQNAMGVWFGNHAMKNDIPITLQQMAPHTATNIY